LGGHGEAKHRITAHKLLAELFVQHVSTMTVGSGRRVQARYFTADTTVA
jgi:hypothetical protein